MVLIVLSNAIDASSPEGEIVFELQEKIQDSMRFQSIVLSDQGEGIPEENRERIFEQFFTTRSKGTGLGLAICKKIVDLHNGSILFDHPEKQGTTIRLNFPVQHQKSSIEYSR